MWRRARHATGRPGKGWLGATLFVMTWQAVAAHGAHAAPGIGGAKQAPPCVADGVVDSFVCPFTVYVENLGDTTLDNLQIIEDLSATFPAPMTFAVDPLQITTTDGLSPNPGFDGDTDTNLLTGNDSLAIGTTATVSFDVQVSRNGSEGPKTNTVVVVGEGPSVTQVSDVSGNGTDPDPDGNGFAGDPGEDDPTPVVFPVPVPSLSGTGLSILAGLIALRGALRKTGCDTA